MINERRDPANEITRNAIDDIKINVQDLNTKLDKKQERIPLWLAWAVFIFMFSTITGIVSMSYKQGTITEVMATKMDHLKEAIDAGNADRFSNSSARHEFNLRDDRILHLTSTINEHSVILKELDKRLDKIDK